MPKHSKRSWCISTNVSTMIASRLPMAEMGGKTSPSCKKLSLQLVLKAWAGRPRDENRALHRRFGAHAVYGGSGESSESWRASGRDRDGEFLSGAALRSEWSACQ